MVAAVPVWALVLNFRGAVMAAACVRSVMESEPRPHILVIDNGSGGDDWDQLRGEFEDTEGVELTQTGTNLGYAGGMQWGVVQALEAGAELIWLLNNDCVVEPASLAPLVREMEEHPRTAACSGVVIHPKEEDGLNAGSNLDLRWGRVRPVETRVERLRRLPDRYEVDFVAGHAWLLRAAAIREIGGLDCRLFAQGEEPDWCFRARRAGYRAVVVTSSVVHAEASATMRQYRCEQIYLATRNMTWLVRRQCSPLAILIHHVLLAGYRLPKAALGLLARGQGRCIPGLVRGAFAGLVRSARWSDRPRDALRSRPPSMM